MQLVYTAEHLQVLWPCAPPAPPPHSGKWRETCPSWVYGSGAYAKQQCYFK